MPAKRIAIIVEVWLYNIPVFLFDISALRVVYYKTQNV